MDSTILRLMALELAAGGSINAPILISELASEGLRDMVVKTTCCGYVEVITKRDAANTGWMTTSENGSGFSDLFTSRSIIEALAAHERFVKEELGE